MTDPSWFAMPDVMQTVIMLLFGAFIWFAIRTLQQIDKNQCELFRRMSKIEREFYSMRGSCEATHNRRWNDRNDHTGDNR